MKIGDLIQHRAARGFTDGAWRRDEWGIGMIVGHCQAGTCEARVHRHAHWILHFPNRKYKDSTAEFQHTRVSEGLDKDNLKWVVVE